MDFKYITVYNSESATTTSSTTTSSKTPSTLLGALQQSKQLTALLQLQGVNVETDANGKNVSNVPGQAQMNAVGDIVWSGTSFSGTHTHTGYNSQTTWTSEVNGTVSSDGLTLLTLQVTMESPGTGIKTSFSLTNVPIKWPSPPDIANFQDNTTLYQGAEVGPFVGSAKYTQLTPDNSSYSYGQWNYSAVDNYLRIDFNTYLAP